MTEINKEVLEAALNAAAKVYASQDRREPPTPSDIEGTAEDLRSPINAFLALAGLVPRGEDDEGLRHELKVSKITNLHILHERDEARREAEEPKGVLAKLEHVSAQEMAGFKAMEILADGRGKQTAALREALLEAKSLIRTWHNMPISSRRVVDGAAWDIYDSNSPEMKRINAALTDTAKAAASKTEVTP